MSAPPDDADARTLALPSGYAVSVTADGAERLTVRAPDGRVCVTITLTAQGPAVEIDAASLSIASRGALRLEADELSLASRGALTLAAEGDVVVQGRSQHLVSTHGDIHVEANDDVRVDGERIKLNAPEPHAAGRSR